MNEEEKTKILSLLRSIISNPPKDPTYFEATIHDLYLYIDKIKVESLSNTNTTL